MRSLSSGCIIHEHEDINIIRAELNNTCLIIIVYKKVEPYCAINTVGFSR